MCLSVLMCVKHLEQILAQKKYLINVTRDITLNKCVRDFGKIFNGT